jgi:hypothetical protein
MNSLKCSKCEVVNLESDIWCRRCGSSLMRTAPSKVRGPREAAQREFPLFSIIIVGVAFAFVTYVYTGLQKEIADIGATDAQRIATQAKQQQSEPLSRSEADQKQAGQYKSAVQDAPAIAQSKKRLAETEKLMAPTPTPARKR